MEENPEILKITIEISQEIQAKLSVHLLDDPNELALSFVSSYKLDDSIRKNLENVIKSHQQSYQSKKSSFKKSNKSNSLTNLTDRIMQHSYRYSEVARKVKNFNYGQLLYEKGLEFKENQRNSSVKHQKDVENEFSNLTFHPTISHSSVEIVKNLNKDERIRRNKDLVDKLKAEKEENDKKECYFVPMITKRAQLCPRNNIFSELYKDSERRNSPQKSTILKKKNKFKSNEEVLDRLVNSKQKTELNLIKKRLENDTNFDKETGQKLFTPVILKKSSSPQKRNVWDDLYNTRTSEKKQDTTEKLSVTNGKSEKLFENLKKNRFLSIFKKLDSDNDGKISSQSISINNFDRETIVILAPVLVEIEKSDKEIDQNEFLKLLDSLYAKLATQDKMFIMKSDQEPSQASFSFTPSINKRSKNLKNHLGENLFDRSVAAKELKEMKQKKLKEIKEKERQNNRK